MTETTSAPLTKVEKEKIIFEIQPMLIPTILNIENLVIIGFTVIAVISSVVFHFGLTEILIVAALFLLLVVPSLRSIFMTGSTFYVLTNRRLVIFTAGVRKTEKSIPLEEIQSVKVKQSGLQRVTGAGEIEIKRKGLKNPTRLRGLQDCKKRAEQIRQAMRKL